MVRKGIVGSKIEASMGSKIPLMTSKIRKVNPMLTRLYDICTFFCSLYKAATKGFLKAWKKGGWTWLDIVIILSTLFFLGGTIWLIHFN